MSVIQTMIMLDKQLLGILPFFFFKGQAIFFSDIESKVMQLYSGNLTIVHFPNWFPVGTPANRYDLEFIATDYYFLVVSTLLG